MSWASSYDIDITVKTRSFDGNSDKATLKASDSVKLAPSGCSLAMIFSELIAA